MSGISSTGRCWRKAASAGRPSLQLRSRAHEIAVETVEKKSLSPWRNLEQLRMLGAYAPPGSAPFDLVILINPPLWGPLRHCRCG